VGERDPDRVTFTVVGCGTVVPEPDHVCSGYFVEAPGARLLLDCGPGVVHHMARFGLPWSDLTHVAITHFHNDHLGELPGLLFSLKHGQLPPRTSPLTLVGPVGLGERRRHLAAGLGEHVTDPGFPVEAVEIEPDRTLSIGSDLVLRCHHTPHTDHSLAYRIDGTGWSVGYTGDTGYSEEVAAFLHGCDLLAMECSLPEDRAMDTHLTPERAARMARRAEPGELLIVHVYPLLARDSLPGLLRAAGWTGRTTVAADGLRRVLA
jgi:ribonuclease BN (tRNA processing enzyme)